MIKREHDVQMKIADILKKFVGKKFNGVEISRVETEYEVKYDGERRIDIVVFTSGHTPLLIIETKKKRERESGRGYETMHRPTSDEALGQVFSYAAILKLKGLHVPFAAVANEKQIVVFTVPEDIDKRVDWNAVKNRDYGRVLRLDYIEELKENHFFRYLELKRLDEEPFVKLLDALTSVYAKSRKLEDVRQDVSWLLIGELRSFVESVSTYIRDAIAQDGEYTETWAKKVEEYAKRRGYRPTPDQLAREISYVLLNKILFYRVLQQYYSGLDPLEPLYSSGKVKTVTEYLNVLRRLFSTAVERTGDFEPVFKTGIYDDVVCADREEVRRDLDSLINLVNRYKFDKLGQLLGYIYEELIPAEERHQLGQFYTPKPIAELIVKWSVRSPDDKVLDPGCGSGTFLIEAYRRLAELKLRRAEEKYVPKDVHEQILAQLYGVDINEFPAHLTAVNLAMRNPLDPSNITNILVRDYFTIKPGEEVLAPYRVTTVRGEERLSVALGNFDAVIGNPPYTRWTEVPEDTRRRIRDMYGKVLTDYELTPQVARGVEPGLYVYWIIHSTYFLKDGGRLGMIISDSWLQTDYGIKFGRFLLDHYRVKAVIDIAARVFPVPLVGACIVLAERDTDEERRMENKIVFMLLRPEASLDVNRVLALVKEYSEKDEGYYPVSKEIAISVVKQKTVYDKNVKWINFIFNAEYVIDKLRNSPHVTKLSNYFEASYGNIMYTYLASTGTIRGVRNIGGNEFFYLDERRVKELGMPVECLYPLVPSPRCVKFFTFTKEDWMKMSGERCGRRYLFLCRKPRNELPQKVRKYIEMGEEGDISLRGGRPVSDSEAAKAREQYKRYFYGWYDLGGVVKTRVFAVRYSQYWHRFVYSSVDVALDDDIMALIPRVEFTETELKGLLSFLNSSFRQLQVELRSRTTGMGMLSLEASVLNDLLILDVKKLPEGVVERLASLFDKLEAEARRLGGADTAENIFGSELARELTGRSETRTVEGLFNTVIKEIDYEVGKILGFTDDEIDAVRSLVVELARRRLARAGEPETTAIKGGRETRAKPARGQRSIDEFF